MKDKVLIFIIGFLVGAIVATCGFLIYEKTKSSNKNSNNNFPGGNMPQMMERDGNMENMPTPPQMPDDEEPPQMPNNFTEKKSKKSNGAVDQNDENSKIENKINKKEETNI